MIGFAKERHPDQPPVSGKTPAVIRAGKDGRVALVVAAHLHASMPARIEEHMDCISAVAAQDRRFLAHARNDVIARVRNLALVADEQPGTSENLLLLLGVDLVVDKDLATDLPRCEVNETGAITLRARHRHAYHPYVGKENTSAQRTKAPYGAMRLSSLEQRPYLEIG